MTLKLFDAFGIEMEYMIVDRDTLDVRPIADEMLSRLSGREAASDYESGPITWSNELARHVIELKTTLPASNLRSLPSQFEIAIGELRPVLEQLNVRLLPTAMHPWMDPTTETQLWPHENAEIYNAFDRIFDCRTHGWANVQSVHLNLPFDGDAEFARLHAAVRLVLPLLPALAASSPLLEGRRSGLHDNRMHHYAGHCHAMPSLTGDLIPEPIYDEATYRREVFAPIASDVQPHDVDGVFEVDFLNARGAIARFDRGSVELRVMDVQEYAGADVAICAAAIGVIKSLVSEDWSRTSDQQPFSTRRLRDMLDRTTVKAEFSLIVDRDYLQLFNINKPSLTAKELWATLLDRVRRSDQMLASLFAPIDIIMEHGTLATRIITSLGPTFDRQSLHDLYDELADCLDTWEPFKP
ncbi:glutamate-cysteine ligase family protein [Aporhodopirellula aestuarii]|uniref:Glutamate-cysteine ligase family protein n=1 Tax=Aporhodopirellula aestuarii TaxID=2950107 RepID=A0ABT0UC95_9BACT|nr:glutamate-cysteine ligase family protein [Aporhodopirellula aestuarii]MCM2374632.1 glutamate-cysteine ligase family protein [Aporhodopirellula aestuarii]